MNIYNIATKSLIFVLSMGLLSACGDKDEDTGTEQEAEETEEVEEEVSEGEDSGSNDLDTGAE